MNYEKNARYFSTKRALRFLKRGIILLVLGYGSGCLGGTNKLEMLRFGGVFLLFLGLTFIAIYGYLFFTRSSDEEIDQSAKEIADSTDIREEALEILGLDGEEIKDYKPIHFWSYDFRLSLVDSKGIPTLFDHKWKDNK